MITRVTTTTMMNSASHNMRSAASELGRLQERASTQKTIARPSDDPAGTAAAMRVRSEQRANAQYARNIADGKEWLTMVDSTLSTVTDLLRKAGDLALQGSNEGTMSPAAKAAIAVELGTIRDSLLSAANTEYLGRNIFAGNADVGYAFARPTTPGGPYVSAAGDPAQPVERRIAEGVKVTVDGDGLAIFGIRSGGGTSMFAEIDAVMAALNGDPAKMPVSGHLVGLADRLTAVVANQASSGARQATLIAAADTQLTRKVDLESQRARIEDVNLGEVILELKMQETVYQASLAVTARALQPTLMDFLR